MNILITTVNLNIKRKRQHHNLVDSDDFGENIIFLSQRKAIQLNCSKNLNSYEG